MVAKEGSTKYYRTMLAPSTPAPSTTMLAPSTPAPSTTMVVPSTPALSTVLLWLFLDGGTKNYTLVVPGRWHNVLLW